MTTLRSVLLCLALLAAGAGAVERSDLYTAEVVYLKSASDGRARAYRQALTDVLRRLVPEGSRGQANALFDAPGEWVIGWRETSDNGQPMLIVSFDGVAMIELLRAQGVPVWGSDRPLTLIWLAVEARDGERRVLDSLSAFDNGLAMPGSETTAESGEPVEFDFGAALAEAASRHGIPVRLPRLDETDRAAVTDSDIWGGFTDVVLRASARYDVDSVLIGRVSARSPTQVRWTWSFAGDERPFSGDADAALARVSSGMMARLASSPEVSAGLVISVVGVEGLDGYGRLMQFLNSRSLLSAVRVLSMRGDEVLLSVDALASRARAASLLDGNVLEQIEPPVRAVPFAGSSGDQVIGSPSAPKTIGEIAGQAPSDAGPDVTRPAQTRVDLYFRLRLQEGGER